MATRKLTMKKLKSILTERLHLETPQFLLERSGDRIVGDVISPTFRGKRDLAMQERIWDALEAELGPQFNLQVGMLLAFTPDEWNLGEGDEIMIKKKKKAG